MGRLKTFMKRHPFGTLAIIVVGGFVILMATLQMVTIWWYSFPPKRPSNVPAEAVFAWGLGVGLPAPKRGYWVNCWFDSKQDVDQCRVSGVNGKLIFEGVFLAYQGQSPISESDLVIDPEATNRNGEAEIVEVDANSQESSRSGFQVVPLVFLRNGNVLIPAKAYQAGKKRLDEIRARQTP